MGYGNYTETLIDRHLSGKHVDPQRLRRSCEFYANQKNLGERHFRFVHNTLGCTIEAISIEIKHITPWYAEAIQNGGGLFILRCRNHGVESDKFDSKTPPEL